MIRLVLEAKALTQNFQTYVTNLITRHTSIQGNNPSINIQERASYQIVKLWVAYAPGMPGTFFPAADFKGNCCLTIPACITARASRTCRDACRDRLPVVAGKTNQAFPAHAHPQFDVSGKRPIQGGAENMHLNHHNNLRIHLKNVQIVR